MILGDCVDTGTATEITMAMMSFAKNSYIKFLTTISYFWIINIPSCGCGVPSDFNFLPP